MNTARSVKVQNINQAAKILESDNLNLRQVFSTLLSNNISAAFATILAFLNVYFIFQHIYFLNLNFNKILQIRL